MIDWMGFFPTTVLVSMIPGASQLLGLRNAMHYGLAPAMIAVLGRLVAFAIFIGLVVVGFGALLTASVVAFTVIKWAGVAYLMWIGLVTLWQSAHESATAAAPPAASRRLARQEFLVAITNPKAMLLFAALLPQFTGPGPEPLGLQLAILGAAYLVIETVVAVGYTTIGASLHASSRSGSATVPGKVQRRIDQLTGTCFLGLAAYLAVSSA